LESINQPIPEEQGQHLPFVSFFLRSPVSSDGEPIYVNDRVNERIQAYISALLASGFRQNDTEFTPCPLGTFSNLSTEGVDGCQKCPPGNF